MCRISSRAYGDEKLFDDGAERVGSLQICVLSKLAALQSSLDDLLM